MNYRFACLALAALGAAALPHAASAADYYDEGRGAPAYHGRDEVEIDTDSTRILRRRDSGDRRFPGPVVFDERAPGWRPPPPRPDFAGPAYGERGPVAMGAPGFVGPRAFGPDEGYGPPERPLPRYGAAAAPLYGAVSAPLYGDAFDPRFGRPDAGCTVERAESITPAGWRKVVTHRTCYHR